MKYVLIIHEVEDFETWKKGFDQASLIRKEAGEFKYQVLAYDNDNKKIVHFSHWESHVKAKAFFESEEVKQIRKDLGVVQPEFIYLNEIEEGKL